MHENSGWKESAADHQSLAQPGKYTNRCRYLHQHSVDNDYLQHLLLISR